MFSNKLCHWCVVGDNCCYTYQELTGTSLSLNAGQCCELYNGTIFLVFEEHMIGEVMEIGE